MIDKKQLIEELLECVKDATDTETQITGLSMCASLMNEVLDEAINYTHSCETLEVFEEIVFEDWLKQHRFTKDINHYIKNNITYREWEVFNMYTMDVYNL